MLLVKSDTSLVYGDRHMLVLVSVDSDYHLNITITAFVPDDSRHVYLLEVVHRPDGRTRLR